MGLTRAIIGVDVGGTNTDAVIVETSSGSSEIIGKCKTLTTDDVTCGVRAAIHLALIDSHRKYPQLAIQQINIGTTHFINAVVEGQGLTKVSVIRLCGTASRYLPPFSDFPGTLVNKVRASIYLVDGGYQIDGSEISPINTQELQNCIDILKSNGERNIVVSGVFSSLRDEQEKLVANFIQERYPEASITASHTIGKIGILERENAAIMNECIKPLCKDTIVGFRSAVSNLGLKCPLYLTQNDGTLLSEEAASQYPVLSFASGATNSMRGAAFLSGIKTAIVVDIGGTSSDVGLLMNGFPREASAKVSVGGVKTNFRMPDVVSIGLGGGSYVAMSEKTGSLQVTVGPQSAGYCIEKEAYVFAQPGETSDRVFTATDIAVAAGVADVGLKSNVKHLDKQFVRTAMDQIHSKLSECVDQMRFANEAIPLILVGGGSILVDTKYQFEGVTEIIKPKDNDVANAVGAALSQISCRTDRVVDLEVYLKNDEMEHAIENELRTLDSEAAEECKQVRVAVKKKFLEIAREDAINEIKQITEKDALKAGAKKGTLTVVEKEDIPLAYIPGHRTRIILKVAGDLDSAFFKNTSNVPKSVYTSKPETKLSKLKKQAMTTTGNALIETFSDKFSIQAPNIDEVTGEWILSDYDIECLHIGAGIMGCGGGGNPHIARTLALRLLKSGKQIRVVNPARFLQNADEVNDVVTSVAFMGAPLALYEKLVAGNETIGALDCIKDIYQVGEYDNGELRNTGGVEVKSGDGVQYIEDYKVCDKASGNDGSDTKKPRIIALMSAEIGGMNCIEPLIVSASLNLPVLDCDGMGRAFPELQMFAPFIYGSKPYPAALVDDKGQRAVVLHADNPKSLENHFRQEVIKMGCIGGTVLSVFRKDDVLTKTVQYSVSHAWRIGDTVMKARSNSRPPVDALLEYENGTLLIYGKVIDISRESTSGFTVGKIVINGLDNFDGNKVLIEFQNEFLVARSISKESKILACVPDLITVVDPDTAQPVPTEEIRFGIRVSVVAMRSHPLMSSERALKFVGPQAFGFGDDVKYVPLGEFRDTVPVCPE